MKTHNSFFSYEGEMNNERFSEWRDIDALKE